MSQPRLNLRPPIATFADPATLAALAEAAQALMDSADQDHDRIMRFAHDDRAGAEAKVLADAKVAKALRLLNLHNALEALLPDI